MAQLNLKKIKKIICFFTLLIILISCSNSSKIENKYWIELNETSPEILLFKNGIMLNLTKNESTTYEIKDNFINDEKGNATTKIEIKDLNNDILTLTVDNKITSFKEAKDSDFILGNWKSNEYNVNFHGDGSFAKEKNTDALWKKTFSTDIEKNAELLNQAITEAQESNEDGTYTYNNNELTLNGRKYKAKLSEDKKELQLDFKDKKIMFKRD